VFDQALTWASKTDKGVFWKSVLGKRSTPGQIPLASAARSSKELISSSLSKINRNEEDEQWLEKLRNFGLKPEDELKLLALGEYIWRLSK
ncbi:hypothetical protein, partial [Escherichia coli]